MLVMQGNSKADPVCPLPNVAPLTVWVYRVEVVPDVVKSLMLHRDRIKCYADREFAASLLNFLNRTPNVTFGVSSRIAECPL